jgi:hypothetical protein
MQIYVDPDSKHYTVVIYRYSHTIETITTINDF